MIIETSISNDNSKQYKSSHNIVYNTYVTNSENNNISDNNRKEDMKQHRQRKAPKLKIEQARRKKGKVKRK